MATKKRYPTPSRWTPMFPTKYRGDVNNIIIRSSWERRFFDWCDMNTNVIAYASEEVVIPYICGTDNRHHSYYIDAWIRLRGADGTTRDYLVEIKPYAQTIPPKFPGKQTKRYVEAVETYVKNQSKWEAAKRYARDRNMQFVVLTEKEIFGTK